MSLAGPGNPGYIILLSQGLILRQILMGSAQIFRGSGKI
jgi:hypothetical protein